MYSPLGSLCLVIPATLPNRSRSEKAEEIFSLEVLGTFQDEVLIIMNTLQDISMVATYRNEEIAAYLLRFC